ncbi:MAG TPA: cytochrome c biogenesis protein CcdA [Acidimicrobiales bacterium]|nr:cytochrome c biogenesis protein CcdA [Acidimicrobiales bacterium]
MQHLVAHSPLGFVIAFAAGIASFLSPCVLPLVPSYLSLMSGVGTSQLAVATTTDQKRLVRATLAFVAGFSVVFVALGATASTLGQTLKGHQTGLNQVAGAVIIVMGLVLAGALSPAFIQRERRFHVLPSQLGAYAPPIMGMAFAFGWSPCIGPALGAVLTMASSEQTLARGVVLLACYSVGLGVPFVVAGVAFGRLAGVFSWVKVHFRVVNAVSGLVLAAFGVLLLTNNVGYVSHFFIDLLDRLGLQRLSNI